MTDERAGSDRIDLHSRRRFFAGAGAVGAAAVLAACQPESNDPDSFEIPEDPGAEDGADDGQASEGLVATGDVEVGGGVILSDQNVVVTRPEEDQWRAFSATCTHQGCLVSEIRGDVIFCNCHGSEYSIQDGSVVKEASGVEPGTQDGLPPVEIEVDGDRVVRA